MIHRSRPTVAAQTVLISLRRLTTPPASFNVSELDAVRAVLGPLPPPIASLPAHTCFRDTASVSAPDSKSHNRAPVEAAVLIPLLNIRGKAHVLMEVRAASLRVHASEASFPGGKADSVDITLMDTALRETEEELALSRDQIEILGALEPEYSLGNRSRVWPIIGFVHATEYRDNKTGALQSVPLSSLCPSPDEVAALLPVPVSAVVDQRRQSAHYFRLDGRKPYWKLAVSDLVHPTPTHYGPQLEVWGLSGWFLSRLALRLGWTDTPEVFLPPDDD